MLRGFLSQQLAKLIVSVLVALLLYGVYSGTALASILVLFVAVRLSYIAAEAMRKPITAEQWGALLEELTRIHDQSTPEERANEAAMLKLDPGVPSRELAQAQVTKAIHQNPPPRRKLELTAETLGLSAFAILVPTDIALYTREFFSLRTPQGWSGVAVIGLCLAAYAWPHRWLRSPGLSTHRILWWALPFCPALLLLNQSIESRHPYLNPFHPERTKLAAEQVLALKNNVVAGRHADWVLRYARELDEHGRPREAAFFYREGLRLDANRGDVAERLATLEAQLTGRRLASAAKPAKTPSDPFATTGQVVSPLPRRGIDPQLEGVEECTVVLLAVGEVSEELLDAVGVVIRDELSLPVYVSSNSVPLPSHTRVRGLITGRQWDHTVLLKAVQTTFNQFPKAPIKYVLVTPVDIYGEDVNYTFSISYEWGALVSFARFADPEGDDAVLRHRTAKQSLCALIKSFKVPMSPDRDCVTSYTRTLAEFDAKGNRPTARTLALFQRAVADLNTSWHRHKVTPNN